MNQPSIQVYKYQLLEAKLTPEAATCSITHCDVTDFIKHMQYLAKLTMIEGYDNYANFRVKSPYTQPYQVHLAFKLLRYKRGT